MMTRQAELGETARDAIRAVTVSVQEMAHVAQGMSLDIGRLEERTQRTESEVQEERKRTEEQLNALQEAVDNATCPAYEMKVGGNIRSLLRQHLNLRNAHMLKGPNREPDREFADALDRDRDAGLITEEELNAALLLDIIAQVTGQDGQLRYAAMEISITVDQRDVARAQERADAIEAAIGITTVPVVVGASANERATAMTAEERARMVRYPAG